MDLIMSELLRIANWKVVTQSVPARLSKLSCRCWQSFHITFHPAGAPKEVTVEIHGEFAPQVRDGNS